MMNVIGATVRGTVHEREGLPNQDAVAWSTSRHAERLVAAVSDGHGSRTAFRSHTGADLAVVAGVESGRELVDRLGPGGVARFDESLGLPLVEETVDRWLAAVAADLGAQPLLEEELASLAQSDGPAARVRVEADPVLAYGATLLLAVVVEGFALLVQLGDGDILVVPASGPPTRPVPDDPRLLGNETTSLCMRDAKREFRFACVPVVADEPMVLLLATDGLGNAYPNDQSFRRVGTDLLERIRSRGLDVVERELDAYLHEASRHSGDDVTVAVIWTGADHRLADEASPRT